MTEASQQVTSPAPLRPVAPTHHWKSSLRWFGAEFVVVVAGILVALAVSSWAQQQQDNKREREYLRQLSADLQSSEKGMAEAAEFVGKKAQATARVLHRFWQDDLAVDDALIEDLGLPRSTRRFRPVLGTAEALTFSGDLNLIRSDPLRAQIITYLESMKTSLEDINRFDETYYRPAVKILYAGPDMYQFLKFKTPSDLLRARPNKVERVPFPATVSQMLRDRDVYDGYNFLLVAHRNQAICYQDMLEQSRTLRAAIEVELAR